MCIFKPTRNIKFFSKKVTTSSAYEFTPLPFSFAFDMVHFNSTSHSGPIPSSSLSSSFPLSLSPFLPPVLSSLHSIADMEAGIGMAIFLMVESWGGGKKLDMLCRLLNTGIASSSCMVRLVGLAILKVLFSRLL